MDVLFTKIDRGDKLVNGLASEKARWEISLKDYKKMYEWLIGDCILSAIFLSYLGPFTQEYWELLMKE